MSDSKQLLRSLKNPVWAVLEYLWYPFLFFGATRLLLEKLGLEQYGALALLFTMSGLSSLLNIGIGATTIKYISSDIGKGAVGRLTSTLSRSLGLALVGGALLWLLIVFTLWFFGDAIFSRIASSGILRLTGVTAATLCFVEQVDNVLSSALKGAERYGAAASLEIQCKTLQIAIVIGAAKADFGLLGIYGALLISAGIRTAIKLFSVRRMLGINSFWPDFSNCFEMLSFSKWGWLQGIGGIIFGLGDRFIVGSLLGATSLAQYAIASQFSMQIHGFSTAAVSVIFPHISRQLASDPSYPIHRVAIKIFAANFILSTTLAGLLLLFGSYILRIWLGAKVGENVMQIFYYLIAAYWTLSLSVTPYFVLLGLGRARPIAINALLAGIIGIFAMFFGIRQMGLQGAGLGKLVYALVTLSLIAEMIKAVSPSKQSGSMIFPQ